MELTKEALTGWWSVWSFQKQTRTFHTGYTTIKQKFTFSESKITILLNLTFQKLQI
jgi:hypothetical protein